MTLLRRTTIAAGSFRRQRLSLKDWKPTLPALRSSHSKGRLTLEITGPRKRAKPAVAGPVHRRVGRRARHNHKAPV